MKHRTGTGSDGPQDSHRGAIAGSRLVACQECGEPIVAAPAKRARFCTAACRKTWNNRRMKRGAELYDLYMAHRFEREEAQGAGIFKAVNRLASDFRQQDVANRQGRKSWRPMSDVLADHPHLRADVVVRGGAA